MSSSRLKSALGRLLQFVAASAGFFAWWLSMFLLVSLFALNVWKPKFTDLVLWSLLLTGLSSAVYLVIMIRRNRRP